MLRTLSGRSCVRYSAGIAHAVRQELRTPLGSTRQSRGHWKIQRTLAGRRCARWSAGLRTLVGRMAHATRPTLCRVDCNSAEGSRPTCTVQRARPKFLDQGRPLAHVNDRPSAR
ncbi:hypothetical protein OROGR_000813 [Orobanche gracilis]